MAILYFYVIQPVKIFKSGVDPLENNPVSLASTPTTLSISWRDFILIQQSDRTVSL